MPPLPNTYEATRREGLNYAVVRRTCHTDIDDAMVIGAVGKGKGSGATPNGGEGTETRRKANGGQKKCFYCGRTNHIKADCRKLKADIEAGYVDNNGKAIQQRM